MATTSLPPSSLMPERLEFTLSEFYLARRFFGYNDIDFGGNHNSPTYLLLGESTFCKRSHYASIQKRKGRNSWDHQEIPMPLEDRKSWVSSLLVILSGFQQPRWSPGVSPCFQAFATHKLLECEIWVSTNVVISWLQFQTHDVAFFLPKIHFL